MKNRRLALIARLISIAGAMAIGAMAIGTSAIAKAPATAAATAAAATTHAIDTTPGIAPLSAEDCIAMQAANVIGASNPLPCRRLMRVRFGYIDFDGRERLDGEMIVMDALAPHVQRLLRQLRAAKFPLHSAHPLTYYAGDDEASMADNNSSAFNGRPMTGGSAWSKHAYGAAIDINPLQNPYISRAADGKLSVLPPAAAPRFTDRGILRAGMTESIRDLFADNGFLIWGGNWRQPIDYQHFEIGDRRFIEKLARGTPGQAAQAFDRYVRTYRDCVAPQPADAAHKRLCVQQTMQNVR